MAVAALHVVIVLLMALTQEVLKDMFHIILLIVSIPSLFMMELARLKFPVDHAQPMMILVGLVTQKYTMEP